MRTGICIATVRGVRVRCGFSVILLIIGAAVTDMWQELLVAACALLAHELAHLVMARAMGMTILAMEIQPFGFVARIDDRHATSGEQFSAAAAGPVCSLLIGCVTAYLDGIVRVTPTGFVAEFIRFNITLGCINLLPAMPLDGGRMLTALLTKHSRRGRGVRVTSFLGIAFGSILIVLGLYIVFVLHSPNVTALIMGIFLALAAFGELRSNNNTAKLAALMRRTDTLAHGEVIEMRFVALHESVPASIALRNFSANRYNVISVVDTQMNRLGEIDEMALLNGIASHGRDVTIGELVCANHR